MPDTELELVPAQQPGEMMKRVDLPVIWEGYAEQAAKLKTTAETLTVTSVEQVAEMKLARATRLALKSLRVEVEHKRKELVEDLNKQTKEINTAARQIKEVIEPLEARLEEQENFIVRETLRVEDDNRNTRAEEIKPFLTGPLSVDLGKVSADEYGKMLADAKELHELRMERERKAKEAEETRLKAEEEERERIRLENERLKKEAEEMAEAARLAREAAEAETKRIALIENRLLAIREGETDAIRGCATIEALENEIAFVEAREITEELFQERIEDAKQAKASVLVTMREVLKQRKATEEAAEKARIEKEQAAAELARVQKEAEERERIAAEKAAEELRLAQAKAAAEKEAAEKKAAAERKKAKEEQDKRDAKAKAEREAAEAKAREEREAREKIEAELAAKKAAEEKAEAERLAAEKKAAAAPVKEKLLAYAKEVRILALKTFATNDHETVAAVATKTEEFAKWIEKKAGEL